MCIVFLDRACGCSYTGIGEELSGLRKWRKSLVFVAENRQGNWSLWYWYWDVMWRSSNAIILLPCLRDFAANLGYQGFCCSSSSMDPRLNVDRSIALYICGVVENCFDDEEELMMISSHVFLIIGRRRGLEVDRLLLQVLNHYRVLWCSSFESASVYSVVFYPADSSSGLVNANWVV